MPTVGDTRKHTPWVDFQNSVTPHQVRFFSQILRFRKAVSEIFPTIPFSGPTVVSAWSNRGLNIGPGGCYLASPTVPMYDKQRVKTRCTPHRSFIPATCNWALTGCPYSRSRLVIGGAMMTKSVPHLSVVSAHHRFLFFRAQTNQMYTVSLCVGSIPTAAGESTYYTSPSNASSRDHT